MRRRRRRTKSGTSSPALTSYSSYVGKLLVFVGLGIAGLGLLIMLGLPIGRLPGDLYIKRDGFSFYFPVASSIIISVILTLLFSFLRR